MKYFDRLWTAVLLFALAALVLGCTSCAGPMSAGPGFSTSDVEHEYKMAASVEVDCVYPELPPMSDVQRMFLEMFGGLPGPKRYGSAVAVGPGAAMTARHVVDCDAVVLGKYIDGEAMKITLTTYWGNSSEFVVEKAGDSRKQDVALLVATAGREPFVYFAELGTDPLIGDGRKPETWVCLVAAMPWEAQRCGPVSRYERGDEWMGAGYVIYDLHSDGGNSGSGVFDSDGKLVAIHVASVGNHVGGGYVVSRWRHLVPPRYMSLDF